MIGRLLRTALLLLPILMASAMAAEPPPPQRIVSINLCADELLLVLADPGQIADLSTYATDEGLSFLAGDARRFRHDADSAETVIGLAPDLVLAGRFTKSETRQVLKALGYRVVELEPVRSIDDAVAEIRKVAAIIGHPGRGEELVSRINDARARAAAAVPNGARKSVVLYLRRGYVTGSDTLTNELLGLVGLDNAGARLAGVRGGVVPLEKLIAAPPDYLLVSSLAPPAEDQGSALLAHPALVEAFPPARRLTLPARLTVCGGPSLPAAVDWLADQARRARG